MPGHSYKGSSANSHTAAVFPPTPVATNNRDIGFWEGTVEIADCLAGRPTFEGYESISGTGTPTSSPADWFPATFANPNDTGTEYVDDFEQSNLFFICRCRYGFNVSGWSNVANDL